MRIKTVLHAHHFVSISGEADGRGDRGKETLRAEPFEEAVSAQSLAERGERGSEQHLDPYFVILPHNLR